MAVLCTVTDNSELQGQWVSLNPLVSLCGGGCKPACFMSFMEDEGASAKQWSLVKTKHSIEPSWGDSGGVYRLAREVVTITMAYSEKLCATFSFHLSASIMQRS